MFIKLRNTLFLWSFLGIFLLFFVPTTVGAQFDREGGLEIVPKHPEPNATVGVNFSLYGVDMFGSTIRWYVDGIEQINSVNERSIDVTLGDLGESVVVKNNTTLKNGQFFSVSKTITPTLVDLILESDTYVPYFYNGRALPSRESEMRAIAVVHDGGNSPNTSFTYKWSLANSTLFGGPVKGKNVAEITMPRYDKKRLSVEVFDNQGNSVAKNSLILNAAEPELYFYENSPLRGLQERVLGSSYIVSGNETTISGEPYYITPGDLSGIDIEWEVNREAADTNSETPNQITLNRIGEGGATARVDFKALTNSLLPQMVRGVFNVIFN